VIFGRSPKSSFGEAQDVITDDSNSRLVFSHLNRYGTDAMDGYEIKSAVCVSNANQVTDPDLELWLFVSDPRETSQPTMPPSLQQMRNWNPWQESLSSL
jgi:hypothetical protein